MVHTGVAALGEIMHRSTLNMGQDEKGIRIHTTYTGIASKYCSDIRCMGGDLSPGKTKLPASQPTKSRLHRQAVILATFLVK